MTVASRSARGVGFGLRWDFLESAADGLPDWVGPVEVTPDNYTKGSPRWRALERIRERHTFLSHGLALDLGGLDPLDERYIGAIRAFLDQGSEIRAAVTEAARQRLRPVLATAITDAAGFLPMAKKAPLNSRVSSMITTCGGTEPL